MTKILKIESIKQLDAVRPYTDMGNGTYNTCCHSIRQGKPTFVAIVD